MQGLREAVDSRELKVENKEREIPSPVRKLRRMRDRGRPDRRVSNWKEMTYSSLFLERVRISLIAKEL